MVVDLNSENEAKNKLEYSCLSNESTHLDAFIKTDRSKSFGSTFSGNFFSLFECSHVFAVFAQRKKNITKRAPKHFFLLKSLK